MHRLYFILILSLMILSCTHPIKDSNNIVKELQIGDKYFIGKRASDNKSNIYTREIKSGFMSSDTIRHYILNNWTDIEYLDVDGGYCLFKNYTKIFKDGIKIKIVDLSKLNDDYFQSKESEEENKIQKEENDLAQNKSQVINLIQGTWSSYEVKNRNGDPGSLAEIDENSMSISGNNIEITESYKTFTIGYNPDNTQPQISHFSVIIEDVEVVGSGEIIGGGNYGIYTLKTKCAYVNGDLIKITIKNDKIDKFERNSIEYTRKTAPPIETNISNLKKPAIETNISNLKIGDNALGGIIAYILKPGDPGYDANHQHGLVRSIDVIKTKISWIIGCSCRDISSDVKCIVNTSTKLGTGKSNTVEIIKKINFLSVLNNNANIKNGCAASLCANYTKSGYADWYLPSKDELFAICLNIDVQKINGYKIGNIWTSSDYGSDDCELAWCYYAAGSEMRAGNKTIGDGTAYAVRSF